MWFNSRRRPLSLRIFSGRLREVRLCYNSYWGTGSLRNGSHYLKTCYITKFGWQNKGFLCAEHWALAAANSNDMINATGPSCKTAYVSRQRSRAKHTSMLSCYLCVRHFKFSGHVISIGTFFQQFNENTSVKARSLGWPVSVTFYLKRKNKNTVQKVISVYSVYESLSDESPQSECRPVWLGSYARWYKAQSMYTKQRFSKGVRRGT